MKFHIGGLVADSKKQAMEWIRSINKKTEIRLTLTGKDDILFRGIVDMLPDKDERLAGGIQGICVRWNWRDSKVTRGPHIIPTAAQIETRSDGRCFLAYNDRTVPFGFNSAFNVSRKAKEDREIRFHKAARSTISATIIAFRNEYLDKNSIIRCAESGIVLTRDTMAVDHAMPWPFGRIIKEFFKNTIPDTVRSYVFVDDMCEIHHDFADPQVAAAFKAFHDGVANLRIVSRKVNGSLSYLGKGW